MSLSWWIVLIFVADGIIMGIICHSVARAKNLGPGWFWIGFFLSLIGLVWAVALPERWTERDQVPSWRRYREK